MPRVHLALAGALLAVLAMAATGRAEEPAFHYLPGKTPVEFKGKKPVDVHQQGRYLLHELYGLRMYDGSSTSGVKICDGRDLAGGLIIAFDDPGPDRFGHKVARFVLFFLAAKGTPVGPVYGEDAKFFAQAYGNSMFALEIDATREGFPREVVDFNEPLGWRRVYAFAVYDNDEWKPTTVRAKPDSWKGLKDGDWAPNAVILPENYDASGAEKAAREKAAAEKKAAEERAAAEKAAAEREVAAAKEAAARAAEERAKAEREVEEAKAAAARAAEEAEAAKRKAAEEKAAAEKALAEAQAETERAAAQQAAAEAAAREAEAAKEQARAEKAAADALVAEAKAAQQRAVADKAAAEEVAAEAKAAQRRAEAEKAAADDALESAKTAKERAVAERAEAERELAEAETEQERAVAEARAAAARAAEEKAAAEQIASEARAAAAQAAEEKAAAEKMAAEARVATAQAAAEKAAAEKAAPGAAEAMAAAGYHVFPAGAAVAREGKAPLEAAQAPALEAPGGEAKEVSVTWDRPAAPAAKVVLFFLGPAGEGGGIPEGEEGDRALASQALPASLFALEIELEKGPSALIDRNQPIGWARIMGFAVEPGGEWHPLALRLADAGAVEGALVLPPSYAWPK